MRKFSLGVIVPWIFALVLSPGLVRGSSLPDSAYVSGVIGHPQTYALSCESRSAVDWAAYWGVSISEWEFLSGLPSTDNPDTGFVGSYNGMWGSIPPESYGVHARPVAARLQAYGVKAEARFGYTWDELRAEIAAGRPVIIWIIGQMWSGKPIGYNSSDGHNTIVARFEHTMILIGYDPWYVYAIDAYTGFSMTFYINTFLDSWSVLGNMAVTGTGPNYQPTPTLPPPVSDPGGEANPQGNSYTVQRGDYLIALSRKFNIPWEELARINNIYYPYTIFPGQVLILPFQPASPTNQVFLPVIQSLQNPNP